MAKPGRATEILQEAFRVCDRALASDPVNTQALEDLAITATALGESLHTDKDFKGARAVWVKGMAAALRLPTSSGNDGICPSFTGGSASRSEMRDNWIRRWKIFARRRSMRWPEAITELKANIADYDELARLDPGNPQFTDGQPSTYSKLAGLNAGAGDAQISGGRSRQSSSCFRRGRRRGH